MSTSPLAKQSFLLNLHISKWSGQISDSKGLLAAGQSLNSDTHHDKYIKSLFATDALKRINLHAGRIRNHFYDSTLPWLDGGNGRIIPAKQFHAFMEIHREHVHVFSLAVEDFMAGYKDHIEEAKERKGDLFNALDYPPSDLLREKFDITLSTLPFPQSGDFRLDAPQELIDQLSDSLEAQLPAITDRVSEAAESRILDRLRKIDENISGDKRFTRSHLEDLEFVVSLVRDLDGVVPQALLDSVDELDDKILKYTPDQIRHNETLRAKIVKVCRKVKKDLKDAKSQ